tara:strand:+ start:735 stop:1319 length:585 start_codon:yes stop_codon:yes gene_type:complete
MTDLNRLKHLAGLKEDSVDMEKHNTLNDIFQALERLNTEVEELDALDRDMDSSGAGDLTDQLTTFRKHIGALYQVLDRAGRIVPMESVKEDAYSKDMEGNLPKIMKMKKALMDKGMKSGEAMDKAVNHYGFDPDDVSEYLQKKNESVNEAVDKELMDEVIVQIKRDCDMGDYTAIEELLMSCPEDKLRGFLSEA